MEALFPMGAQLLFRAPMDKKGAHGAELDRRVSRVSPSSLRVSIVGITTMGFRWGTPLLPRWLLQLLFTAIMSFVLGGSFVWTIGQPNQEQHITEANTAAASERFTVTRSDGWSAASRSPSSNIMTARGNRWFCNEADAVAAGRRPVKP
jgi:hypothetical protein